jgi:hypothetical protein
MKLDDLVIPALWLEHIHFKPGLVVRNTTFPLGVYFEISKIEITEEVNRHWGRNKQTQTGKG